MDTTTDLVTILGTDLTEVPCPRCGEPVYRSQFARAVAKCEREEREGELMLLAESITPRRMAAAIERGSKFLTRGGFTFTVAEVRQEQAEAAFG